MKYSILAVFLIIICLDTSNAQDNIWVTSNISIDDLIIHTDILAHPELSSEDILIFHGNALNNSQNTLNAQITNLRNKFNNIYIVPGNKDWESFKSKDLKSLGDFLDDEYKGDVIVPENGCGEIEVKDINDDLSIVFIDSEWYFRNWEEDLDINRNCEVRSRSEFWNELRGEIGKLKAKQILLFARHPIVRFDEEAPQHSHVDDIFPLNNFIPGLYIPIPILGTLILDTKLYFTPESSIMSPLYQSYIDELNNILDNHTQVAIITSDANSNYVSKIDNQYNLNVNSSRAIDDLISGDLVYKSQSRAILQLKLRDKQVEAVLKNSYHKVDTSIIILNGRPLFEDIDSTYDDIDRTSNSTITRSIRKEEDMVHFNKLLLGTLNKKFYTKEVTVPQMDLVTLKGGLTPIRLGGGQQTQSLRLKDKNGQVYLARSLKKRPEKALPPSFNHDILHPVMDYLFYGGQPLGALATCVLDSAIGVYHTTPSLMYLPPQKRLGEYNNEIGGELVLFRERADNAWVDKKSFGYSKDIIGSKDMITEMNNNNAMPQKEEYLRARLLDLVLGDWDRHQDQWRWAKDTADLKFDIYHPIARDRDQVFASYDGLLLSLVRPYSPDILQLRSYDKDLSRSDIRWMHWKSSFLDNSVLHFFDSDEWKIQTELTKRKLTDDMLEQSVNKLPESYGDERQRIKAIMSARIEDLDEISENLRLELLDHGIVRASDDNDSITITQFEESVHIKIISDFEGKDRNVKFDGFFYEKWTSSIWIYALEGDDIITINGLNNSGIDIDIIGGYDEDKYISSKKIKNVTVIDDNDTEDVKSTSDVKYRYITDKAVHELSRFDLIPQYKFVIPLIAYNSDDGLKVGAEYTWVDSGFKTTSSHKIGANYLTGRKSSDFYYKYQSFDALEKDGNYFEANWSGPQRQLSYYGGNDAEKLREFRFYDVFMSDLSVKFGWLKQITSICNLTVGGFGRTIKVEKTIDKNISTDESIDPAVFDNQFFGGAEAGLEWKNFNDAMRASRGARLFIGTKSRYNFESNSTNLRFNLEYDYYKPLIDEDRLIFSTKLRAGHIFGDYYFYEGFQLGGTNTLRGFRNGRYTGRSSFANNNNLQLKVFEEVMKSILPGSLGLSASFDHGRVWTDFEDSEQWHVSYGGGVWFSPLDLFVFSLGYHQSNEDYQLRLLFNWQF